MFKKCTCLIIWFFSCSLASVASSAQIAPLSTQVAPVSVMQNIQVPSVSQIQAGIHYKRLSEKIRSNKSVKQLTSVNADKVQVIMFFNYGCSVCRGLNKPFDEWSNKQDKNKVIICKLPVSFNRGWGALAQAFFTVQALHKSEQLDEIIFSGVHDKAMPLWIEQKLAELLFTHGIDKTLFNNTFHSFSVNSQVKWANELSLAFELSAIPNIIISGPYNSYVTNLSMAKNQEFLFAIIDHLVKKELKSTI